MEDKIKKEIERCFDVSKAIGEESVAFLAVVVVRDKKDGGYRSTVINTCEKPVNRKHKEMFSDKMHKLARLMKNALVDDEVKHTECKSSIKYNLVKPAENILEGTK